MNKEAILARLAAVSDKLKVPGCNNGQEDLYKLARELDEIAVLINGSTSNDDDILNYRMSKR